MGRYQLAIGRRARTGRHRPALPAAAAVAAVLFAAAGSADPSGGDESVGSRFGDAGGMKVVAAAPAAEGSGMRVVAVRPAAASRSRVVEISRFLPAGVAPERGLQVRTILAARSISEAFPQIHQIAGVRADALRWHPGGYALDVMIPAPGTAEGIALGDEIVAFALKNADRFGLRDAIWRGVYYTPGGEGRGYGHYDHVHITTSGGGYPTGNEGYLR